jgi:hypothetical protein
VELLFITSGVPLLLVWEKEKPIKAPTATFSDKNFPTIGEMLKLTAVGLSVVMVPLSNLPPDIFNPKFPPRNTCAFKKKGIKTKITIRTILFVFI